MDGNKKLPVTEASEVGTARRAASLMAEYLGFDEAGRGEVAIVVTEIATNLARYAVHGELLLRELETQGVAGLEILGLDKGPGIANLTACLRDGYSTGGTPGNGMGAIVRLSTVFDIHSLPDVGTALESRLWSKPLPTNPTYRALDIGAVCLPKPGQEVCGDAWAVEQSENLIRLLVVDGLGHGQDAAQAAREAVRIFRLKAQYSPKELLEATHAALRSTRGAAAAVVEINRENRQVRFAGVGNISATIHADGHTRSMVSHNGIVGHKIHKIQEFVYDWPDSPLLLLHSDGLATQWRLDRYSGLTARNPAIIAGVLYRDFQRGNDDITVLAAREP